MDAFVSPDQEERTAGYDVIAIGAHPDDLEAVMGGTTIKLVRSGRSVLYVDLCDGEPARYAERGIRPTQAKDAADILGVDRITLPLKDRLIVDGIEPRLRIARILRQHKPRVVFTTSGSGVHPDHKAATEIVAHGIFYARLPKWDEVPGGEYLRGTDPHEIDRLFFGHCRMEPAWDRFDFAIDVTAVYDRKQEALRAYQSVFSGERSALLNRYSVEDRYVGGLVNVEYAESFRARTPLLVDTPEVFLKSRYG